MNTTTAIVIVARLGLARKAGLTTLADLQVLLHICDHGESQPSEVAQAVNLSKAVATLAIDRLQKRGYVRRERPVGFASDRRAVKVTPTFTGRELHRQLNPAPTP